MNYLAHLALSGSNPEMRVGGFLGDWLKGPLHAHGNRWPTQILAGVQRHRAIDAWIDRQPQTQAAAALLGPGLRRLSGPVIDITFDHFLAQQFSRWHRQPLDNFCTQVHAQLAPYAPQMPAGAQRFLQRAEANRLFERYGDPQTFFGVVGSLRKRISKPALLDDVEQTLARQLPAMEALFNDIYPALMDFAASQPEQLSAPGLGAEDKN